MCQFCIDEQPLPIRLSDPIPEACEISGPRKVLWLKMIPTPMRGVFAVKDSLLEAIMISGQIWKSGWLLINIAAKPLILETFYLLPSSPPRNTHD